MTRLLPFTLCRSLLYGCDAADTMKSGFEHSTAVSADLERSVGAKSFVGFNWNNGSLTHVTVTFETIPKGKSLEKIAELSRGAVLKHFKQAPQQIIVGFTISP